MIIFLIKNVTSLKLMDFLAFSSLSLWYSHLGHEMLSIVCKALHNSFIFFNDGTNKALALLVNWVKVINSFFFKFIFFFFFLSIKMEHILIFGDCLMSLHILGIINIFTSQMITRNTHGSIHYAFILMLPIYFIFFGCMLRISLELKSNLFKLMRYEFLSHNSK